MSLSSKVQKTHYWKGKEIDKLTSAELYQALEWAIEKIQQLEAKELAHPYKPAFPGLGGVVDSFKVYG